MRLIFFILLLTSTIATQAEPVEQTLTPVTLQLQWQHQFQFAGIYAAIEKGFYRNAGLAVTIKTGFTHPYDEVENGDVEFGLAGTSIVVEYIKGRPFVALGATFQNSPYAWLVSSDSGIYSAEDFIGKTLTQQSYADDLSAIFLKQNIDSSKIHFVPPTKDDIDNLISGKVDGISAYVSNEPFFMEQRHAFYRTIAPKDYGINFYSDILFTSQQYLKHHPETVEAFRKATYRGWRYAAEHQDEIIDLILQKYNTQHKTREHLQFEATQLLKLSLFPAVNFGHMTKERWQIIAETYKGLGLYDSVKNLDPFLYVIPDENNNVFKWLVLFLALASTLILLGYLVKKHHNKLLTEHIHKQTASLEEELKKRKALESVARHEEMRLQTLLDNTIDSVITINQRGIIENYNKASITLFGYQPDEVIGKNITMLMPPNYRDLHKLGMARFLSTEQSRILGNPVEIEALHKDGHILPIELTISEFLWEDQYLFTGVARDISKQKAEQQALLEAKKEAERANNAKSEFLSAMSHELRTPLNGILGFSQLLLSDESATLNEQQIHNVKQIIHSGEHLLTLINDVLELAKIEAGQIKTSSEKIAIKTIIDECLPMLETLANKHAIHIDCVDTTNPMVIADYTKLKQVFINLVINAVKYNRRNGKISISVSQQANKTVRLMVTDTGMGISPDKQSKVFTAFERLGQEYAEIEGSGVGLSVSKRLIEAMNGSINFESTEGKGSCFWIDLPAANESDTISQHSNSLAYQYLISQPLRKTDTESETAPQDVLYIEDNPANVRLMEVYFSRQQQATLHTRDSAEAGFELMKTLKPAVVLMDINLKGMSGIEAAIKMQNDPQLKDIPVIALTAAAMQENIDAAQGVFKNYITKPIDFNQLSKALQAYLT